MVTLLPAVWALLFLSFVDGVRPRREAALIAFTAVTVAVLAVTEALSLLHAMSSPWLMLAWGSVTVALAVAMRVRVRCGIGRLREYVWRPVGWVDGLFAGLLSAFLLGTLLSALLYPITNYDSLTYHMPRVLFWFQNHSIAHYPTADGRQLFSSALVEYFVLNLKVLTGGSDRLANLVQWLSYVFSIVAVSLVAARLGAGRRGQQSAALAAAVTPMAILQASTTQNDLTCALWALVAVYFIVDYITSSERTAGVPWVLWLGSALALSYQSKPPAYIFTAPFLVWLAVVAVRRAGWRRAGITAASVVLVVLVLNTGWYTRNVAALGGDVLGVSAPGNTHILIKDRDPADVVTTALKNSSMLLGTPSQTANDAIASGVRTVVGLYGGDFENPLTKEDKEQSFQIDSHILNHDVGPAPVIVLLVLFSATAVLLMKPRGGQAGWYLLCAFASLFVTAGLITWNHFINRVLLGALLLAIPLVGVAISEVQARSRRLLAASLFALLALSVAWGATVMLLDTTNRLLPPSALPFKSSNRDLGYWNTSYADLRFRVLIPEYEAPMKQIATVLQGHGIRRLGIDSPTNFPIYPLLTLLPDSRFGYVGRIALPVSESPAFAPEAILEIEWADQLQGQTSEPVRRGESLMEPIHAGNAVFSLHRVP